MRVILASASPRRKELLNLMGIEFETIISNINEKLDSELPIEEQVKELAKQKAEAVFNQIDGEKIVIGSDTIVYKENKIYGKPKKEEDAIAMLEELQGDSHKVITSLAVLVEKNGQIKTYLDYDVTEVHIQQMNKQEIKQWIDKGEYKDKAGAYAIQGAFAIHIDKLVGNYYTVVGFPIHKLYNILKNI